MSPELERQVGGLEEKAKRHLSEQQALINELRKLGAEAVASELESMIHGSQDPSRSALADTAFLRRHIP